jgi:hypothetical protein
MALATLTNTKLYLGIALSDTSQDALLNMLITQLTALVEEWLGRSLLQATYTEVYSGSGYPALVLRQRPVWSIILQGSTISGSAVVTGLSSTTGLVVGMPAAGAGPDMPITSGSVISAIGSGQVTLSLPATDTETGPIAFGLAVWEDDTASWGDAPGAFGPGTQLVEGIDFGLVRDQPDGTSRSGMIQRVLGAWSRPAIWRGGWLVPGLGPPQGNVRVQYTAGYASLPADIELGVITSIARVKASAPFGQEWTSQGYEGYSISLAAGARADFLGWLNGPAMPVLARYRNLAV